MRSDRDDDDGEGGFRPVPDRDDRLWRHPSELQGERAGAPPTPPRPSFAARHPLLVTVAAAVAGAAFTSAVWFAVGAEDPDTRQVRERVALSPVVALDPQFVRDEDWAANVADRVAASIVPLEIRRATAVRSASAVVLTSDGHAVVPAHLVADASEVVALRDGVRARVQIVGLDPATDVAVIRLDLARLEPAVFTDEPAPVAGARVALVSAVARAAPRLTDTSVLSIDNQVANALDESRRLLAFRLSRSFDSGSDGGAVVDTRGAVMGIAATGATTAQDGYVMPAGLVRAVAWQLIDRGFAERPWLGLEVVSVGSGVRVMTVADASPAATAGLRPDDVITAVDGKAVASMTALSTIVRERGVGSHLMLRFERSDGEHQCSTTVQGVT